MCVNLGDLTDKVTMHAACYKKLLENDLSRLCEITFQPGGITIHTYLTWMQ